MENIKQYHPFHFYLLTFVITFFLWLIGAYLSFQEGMSAVSTLFMLPGLMAPFIISLIFIFRSKNKHIKKTFIKRLIDIKLIQPKILPILFLIAPFSVIVSIFISLLLGGSISQFQFAEGFSFSAGDVPVLLLLLLAATFEELGWRGYAFDSLQAKFSILKSSIIFGILWSLWHLPLIFVKDSYQYMLLHQNIWFAINFFVGIIPLGIIISWICIKNNKSILVAILFHFIVNISQELLSMSKYTKCIQTFVLIIFAAVIVFYDKDMFFSKKDPLEITS